MPGEEHIALQQRVLELEAENNNLAGLLETITDALEQQEARCAAAEARANQLEQQLSAASTATSSVLYTPAEWLPTPRASLGAVGTSTGGDNGDGGNASVGTDSVGGGNAAAESPDSSSRRSKQLALLQLASQAAARSPPVHGASAATGENPLLPLAAAETEDVRTDENSTDYRVGVQPQLRASVDSHSHADAGATASGASSVGPFAESTAQSRVFGV